MCVFALISQHDTDQTTSARRTRERQQSHRALLQPPGHLALVAMHPPSTSTTPAVATSNAAATPTTALNIQVQQSQQRSYIQQQRLLHHPHTPPHMHVHSVAAASPISKLAHQYEIAVAQLLQDETAYVKAKQQFQKLFHPSTHHHHHTAGPHADDPQTDSSTSFTHANGDASSSSFHSAAKTGAAAVAGAVGVHDIHTLSQQQSHEDEFALHLHAEATTTNDGPSALSMLGKLNESGSIKVNLILHEKLNAVSFTTYVLICLCVASSLMHCLC